MKKKHSFEEPKGTQKGCQGTNLTKSLTFKVKYLASRMRRACAISTFQPKDSDTMSRNQFNQKLRFLDKGRAWTKIHSIKARYMFTFSIFSRTAYLQAPLTYFRDIGPTEALSILGKCPKINIFGNRGLPQGSLEYG